MILLGARAASLASRLFAATMPALCMVPAVHVIPDDVTTLGALKGEAQEPSASGTDAATARSSVG